MTLATTRRDPTPRLPGAWPAPQDVPQDACPGRVLEAAVEWRVHLGAHKTATSHLQATLRALRGRIALEAGVDCLGPHEARKVLGGQLARRHWRYHLRGRLLRDSLEAALGARRLGPGRIVLSEENILGLTPDLLAARPYPRLEARVRAVAALGIDRRLVLFVSLRDFGEVLGGAYATALLMHRTPRERLDAAIARARRAPPSWVPVLDRIRRAAPGVPLRAWRQEDYRDHAAEMAAALVGAPVAPLVAALPPLPAQAGNRTPSAESVARIEALSRRLPRRLPIARWRLEAAAARDAEGEPFRPLDAGLREALAARYRADQEEIEARWPGTLVRPGEAAP